MKDQSPDFLVRKEVGASASPVTAEVALRWDFMARVFGPRKAREANQYVKSMGPLRFGGAQCRPVERRLADHAKIPAGSGEAGIAD